MNSQRKAVLFCTVGGSHEPILKAIETVEPSFICFFCTDRDPETSKPGSLTQITGKGKVIKYRPGDEKPTLFNIPSQVNFAEDRFEPCVVPADDLDGAVSKMREAIKRIADRFPQMQFIADYTGGTKTMSAALVCVALEWEEPKLQLQLVAGARTNLQAVKQGTEQVIGASTSRMRFDKMLKLQLRAWRNFAYHQAECGLSDVILPADSPDLNRLKIVRILSRAFSCWDVFDHKGALESLENYSNRVGKAWPTLFRDLRLLVDDNDKRQTPLRIYDLWLNAKRRANQGRFDDAAARLYRMIEWIAQWQLREKYGLDTGDVPKEFKLPDTVKVAPGREGKISLGLWNSWQVAAEIPDNPIASLLNEGEGWPLRDLLNIRNHSILAHGFKPVGKVNWEQMQSWVESKFLPVFDQLAHKVGLKERPAQLPRDLPDSVLEEKSAS